MSIAERETKAVVVYTINNSDKRELPVTFQFLNQGKNLNVYWRRQIDNSLTKLVYPTEYTVETNEDGASGVFGQVIINDGLDISNGDRIAIERAVPVDQTTTFSAQTVFSSTMDYAIDKLTAIVQDMQFYNNTLHIPLDEENVNAETMNIGIAENRANKILGFDSFGDVKLMTSTSGKEEYGRCLRMPLDEEPVPDMTLYKDVRSGKTIYFDEGGKLQYLGAETLKNIDVELSDRDVKIKEAKEAADAAYTSANKANSTAEETKKTAEEAKAEAKENKYQAGKNIEISKDPITGENVISAESEIVAYKTFETLIPKYTGQASTREFTRMMSDKVNVARAELASISFDKYALFGGGKYWNSEIAQEDASNAVDIIKLEEDGRFTKTTNTLSVSRWGLSVGRIGDYVLFGGGKNNSGIYDIVDVFKLSEDGKFFRTNKLHLNSKRYNLAAASVGNYVMFGGGYGNGEIVSNEVDIFKLEPNGTFTQTVEYLEVSRSNLAAASVGNYALFGGGFGVSGSGSPVELDIVDIFKLEADGSFTKITKTLSEARQRLAAATVGNYVLFGGGNGGGSYNAVDIFKLEPNETFTKTTDTLSEARFGLAAATAVGNYVLFGGGSNDSGVSNVVDIFKLEPNGRFTKKTEELNDKRGGLAAVGIGDYALFVGGKIKDGTSETIPVYTNRIDVFKLDGKKEWEIIGKAEKTTDTFSVARTDLAATSVGNYVMFGGGMRKGEIVSDVVDIFKLEADGRFTKTTDTLSIARQRLAAATVENYVMFGGGYNGSGSSNAVDIFKLEADGRFTKTTDTLSEARYELAAATIGNYVLFGGGYGDINNRYSKVVDIFKLEEDGTFTKKTDTLSVGRNILVAATIGNYVLFGGGSNDVVGSSVDIFKLEEDGTFTKSTDTLIEARFVLAAATAVGNYVLFGDGSSDKVVNIFKLEADGRFTKTTDTLSEARQRLAAATVGNYVMFGGGYGKTIDIFKLEEDGTFTKTIDTLSEARCRLAAATIGNYVLFGGGEIGSDNYSNAVDIFKFSGFGRQVDVPGIKKSDVIVYDALLSEDIPTAKNELREWSKVHRVEPLNDAVKITCFDGVPSIDLNIQIKE